MPKNYTAIRQDWREHEYEPGWGVSDRPDGFSLHISKDALESYVADIEEGNKDQSSSGYHLSFHTSGESKLIIVTEEQHDKLTEKGTIRVEKWDMKDWQFPES